MCGIAGIVSRHPGDFEPAVRAMLSAMAHRGPDDQGLVALPSQAGPGTVVLGSRRLAILDRSAAAHMPMQDHETGCWITYNGEVYNFLELRATFGDVPWRSSGDTEVLLRTYGRDGPEAIARWRGMFALAVWDPKRQRLFLARDRLGIKPLYYWQSDSVFVFASEVRALLASGLVPRHLSSTGAATFLSFGALQDPLTLVDGVYALRSGHWAIVTDGRISTARYWRCSPAGAPDTRSPARVVEELSTRLEESVVGHLVSDVPIGVFLSGGLDSSLIAALAQRRSSSPVSTWAVAFEAPGANEGPKAAAVAQAIGSRHHELTVSAEHLLQQLPQALKAMDQPTIDGLNTYAVAQAVRRAGLTVALSGLGGDELFAGYATFPQSLRLERLARPFRRFLTMLAAGIDPRWDRRQRWGLLGDWERQLGHPIVGVRMVYSPQVTARLLGLPLDTGPAIWGAFAPVLEEMVAALVDHDPVTRVSVFELQGYMANMLLRDTDVMSMAHSIEVRVPFLDHPFVEWALGVPGHLKIGTPPKPLLAAALRRIAPSVEIPSAKHGFVVPLATWLKQAGPLRAEVDSTFRDHEGFDQIGIAPEAGTEVWQRFLRGHCGWAPPWAIYVLRQWVERTLSP